MAEQSIIVTGAGSGIGLSIVNHLLKISKVALVVAVDIQTQHLDEVVSQSGSRLRIVKGDVSEPETSEQAVQAAISQTGRLNAVILNAGILGPISPVINGDVDKWKALFDVNFFSLLHGVQTAFPYLSKNNGRIVFTSSGVSVRPTKSWVAYSCGKAAMNQLCSSLAYEEPSISVVAVTPGIVDTNIQKIVRDTHKDTLDPETYDWLADLHKQGKLLHPDQPAASFVKLATEGIPDEIRGKTVAWDHHLVKTE